MTEVLAGHFIDITVTDPDKTGACVCRRWVAGSMSISWDEHLADELSAAGYGLLAEAQAEAWADGVQTVASINALPEVETARLLADNPYRGPAA